MLALVLFRGAPHAAAAISTRRPARASARLTRFRYASAPWSDFDDLLAANREFAADFALGGFDGVAHAGVAIVTCMDSRIDPLQHGRPRAPATPRSSATPAAGSPPQALEALVLGVHLLGVDRILVVPHTRCAMASNTEDELRERVGASAGQDASWQPLPRRRGPGRRARRGRRTRCARTR